MRRGTIFGLIFYHVCPHQGQLMNWSLPQLTFELVAGQLQGTFRQTTNHAIFLPGTSLAQSAV